MRYNDKILLILRVQNRGRETFFLTAESDNGEDFEIHNDIITFDGLEDVEGEIFHIYDPRITEIDGKYYIMCAMDTAGGCRLGLAETSDFRNFVFRGIVSGNEVRNGVLFPEKIGGKYLRLERPNRVASFGGAVSGSTIVLSESDDLIAWREVDLVMEGRPHFWDERIGSGPPPIKTEAGWLHIYHGVATHFDSVNIYQAGVVLLDLKHPARVLARGRCNILEPREPYELIGQVPNVVFPTGIIVDDYDDRGFAEPGSRVRVYYGAADSTVCLATTTIADLIDAGQAGP